MASNFDVFCNLNEYLNRADDDLFEYDDSNPNSADSSAVTGESEKAETIEIPDVVEEQQPKSSSRDGSFEITPPKKSRRAADAFAIPPSATIELGDIAIEKSESSINQTSNSESSFSEPARIVPKTRSRARKDAQKKPPTLKPTKAPKPAKAPKAAKTPKPKRMTLKEAMAIVSAPIPKMPSTPKAAASRVAQQSSRPVPVPVVAAVQTWDVDLTGDVVLTDQHSKAPLFEKKAKAPKPESDDDLDDSLDYDPDLLSIKVKTKQIKAYPHRRHQRYYDLYKILAEEQRVSISSIFLFDGDKRIDPDDTPHSSNYKISTILTCRVMESKAGEGRPTAMKKNQIELKFQSDKWKKPVIIKSSKLDDFETWIKILCEQVPFKPNQITLRSDGEDVDLKQTPVDLDLDNGECMDCRIKA